MTDADRRKLILLAEARASATDASAVLQRLRINLDQIQSKKDLPETDPRRADLPETDPRRAACRVAEELVERLINLREWISAQIAEVPS